MSKTEAATGPAVTAPADGTASTAPAATDAATDAAAGGTEAAPAAKPELTAEQLVEANRKKNAENKALRDKNKAYEDQFKEFEAWKESQKTEEQKAAERTQALEAENAALKRAALIARVQASTNLPDALVERLRGDTEEELTEDAKALAALVTPAAPAPPAPNPGQSVAPGTEEPGDPRQKAAKDWLKKIGRG